MKQGEFKYLATPIPLYGCLLHILIGHDLGETSRAAGLPDDGMNGNSLAFYHACAFRADKGTDVGYFVLIKPGASANTVAHESVHIVNKVFNDRGIKLDSHNDEPQAYLTGWVVEQVNYALTSKKVKPAKKIKLA